MAQTQEQALHAARMAASRRRRALGAELAELPLTKLADTLTDAVHSVTDKRGQRRAVRTDCRARVERAILDLTAPTVDLQ